MAEIQTDRALDLKRFTAAERALHWSIASAVIFNLTTGLLIWQSWDDYFKIGKFNPVSQAHFWLGGGGIVLATAAFLLLRRDRVAGAPERMNPPQVLNLRAVQVTLLALAASGVLIRLGRALHMSKALHEDVMHSHFVVAVFVLGLFLLHLYMVLVHPKNRGVVRGMLEGKVDARTARRVWPKWIVRIDDAQSNR